MQKWLLSVHLQLFMSTQQSQRSLLHCPGFWLVVIVTTWLVCWWPAMPGGNRHSVKCDRGYCCYAWRNPRVEFEKGNRLVCYVSNRMFPDSFKSLQIAGVRCAVQLKTSGALYYEVQFGIPRVSFCYLHSLTLKQAIRIRWALSHKAGYQLAIQLTQVRNFTPSQAPNRGPWDFSGKVTPFSGEFIGRLAVMSYLLISILQWQNPDLELPRWTLLLPSTCSCYSQSSKHLLFPPFSKIKKKLVWAQMTSITTARSWKEQSQTFLHITAWKFPH